MIGLYCSLATKHANHCTFFYFRNFDHVPNGTGKGCGIFSLESRLLESKHKIRKPLYQIMSLVDQTNVPYRLILIYASSGCPLLDLVIDLKDLLEPEITTVITGDFNFDSGESNPLTRFLLEKKFTQIVNWPTHIEGRTIDHCYISSRSRVQVSRHSLYWSDHCSLLIEFEHFPWF